MEAASILAVILIIVAVLVGMRVLAAAREQERKERIYAKYGQNGKADRIINKTIWVGESATELIDSLGSPEDTDEKVLKTKRKVIWKYHSRGANRYALRVTFEADCVVGWDEKL